MALEIEHKFLVRNDEWRKLVKHSADYRQGYLSSKPTNSIRIRISEDKAWLNIKSATIGNQRHEYEYPIPMTDANEIINNLCHHPIIEKTRHFIYLGAHTWEIDEFKHANKGLIVAEIELTIQNEKFERPSWIGEEVTHDLKYYNNNLTNNPYTEW
jgi:adenylate cyclase